MSLLTQLTDGSHPLCAGPHVGNAHLSGRSTEGACDGLPLSRTSRRGPEPFRLVRRRSRPAYGFPAWVEIPASARGQALCETFRQGGSSGKPVPLTRKWSLQNPPPALHLGAVVQPETASSTRRLGMEGYWPCLAQFDGRVPQPCRLGLTRSSPLSRCEMQQKGIHGIWQQSSPQA
jgi:hypothetical protein